MAAVLGRQARDEFWLPAGDEAVPIVEGCQAGKKRVDNPQLLRVRPTPGEFVNMNLTCEVRLPREIAVFVGVSATQLRGHDRLASQQPHLITCPNRQRSGRAG